MVGEVMTTIKELVEGTCVKHHMRENLLKMYDKQMRVLRVESMLLDLGHFKVFRTKEGDEGGPMSYRQLRKGVADIHEIPPDGSFHGALLNGQRPVRARCASAHTRIVGMSRGERLLMG